MGKKPVRVPLGVISLVFPAFMIVPFTGRFLPSSTGAGNVNAATKPRTSSAPTLSLTGYQEAVKAQDAPPKAKEADVASLDAIMRSVYTAVSGPPGKDRDWNRLRSLFLPGARLIPTGRRKTGEAVSRILTVDDYIAGSSKYLETNGFFEREISRKTELYGNIAHVFSTYESRHKADDPQPFARGINSIQLMNDGKRWWVVTIFWQGETPELPLPPQYLEKPKP